MSYVMLCLGLLLGGVIGYLLASRKVAEHQADGRLEQELRQQLVARDGELGQLRANLAASERAALLAQAGAFRG